MINLHKNIKEKYGLEALLQLCLWEKNVIKVSNYKNHRNFTLRCIGQNLIPVGIRLKPIRSKQNISVSASKIIERAERQLMQDRVRGINNTIQVNKNNGNHNKTRLVSIITHEDLYSCNSFIEKVRQERLNKVKASQVRKFDILSNNNKQNQDSNNGSCSNNRSPQGMSMLPD